MGDRELVPLSLGGDKSPNSPGSSLPQFQQRGFLVIAQREWKSFLVYVKMGATVFLWCLVIVKQLLFKSFTSY